MTFVDSLSCQISFTYTRNKSGPTTLRCVTSDVTLTSSYNCPPTVTLCVRPKGIPSSVGLPSIPRLKPQFKRMPTANGVPRRSPNQVLTMPNVANCGFRTRTGFFNVVWPLVSELLPRRLRFHPRLIPFGFVVDSVILEQGFLLLMQLSHANILTRSFIRVSLTVYNLRIIVVVK